MDRCFFLSSWRSAIVLFGFLAFWSLQISLPRSTVFYGVLFSFPPPVRFSDDTAERCFRNWKLQDCLLAAGGSDLVDVGVRLAVPPASTSCRYPIGDLPHPELLRTGATKKTEVCLWVRRVAVGHV